MKHSVFSFIFVLSIIFCQEKLVHINKTYPDGKPKEILIYKQINDELKSTKPLLLIEKINYDRNGNYITRINLTSANPDPNSTCGENYETIKELLINIRNQ